MGKKSKKNKRKTANKVKMLAEGTKFDVGVSVFVKDGVLDPDYGNDIGGWQGRVFGINDSNDDDLLISIEWDSITLKNMPCSVIESSEKDGLVFSMMDLYASELKLTEARDEEEDVAETLEMLWEKYNLEEFDNAYADSNQDEIDIDKQIERIQAILEVTDEEYMVVDDENLKQYFQYLSEKIVFPCIVTGIEDFGWEKFYVLGPRDRDEYEELKKTQPSYTDEYSIRNLDKHYDEDNGILVNVLRVSDKKEFTLPLGDLEAVDKKSNNYQLLDDYSVWFVNYR